MKTSFWIWTTLLILSRVSDFYSTSLWFFEPDGMKNESNPLTRFFGVGWNGLVFVNIILVIFIIWSYYQYAFRYQPIILENCPTDFKTFVSRLYFSNDSSFYKIFYSLPKNKAVSSFHFGYILIRMVTFASVLATIHNLCQYYNVGIYNTFRSIVIRPHYVIFALILLSFFYFQYRVLKIDFLKNHNTTEINKE